VEVTCQSDSEFPQIVCGPGLAEVFHSLLYRSNLPSGVLLWPNGADEHQADDAGAVLVCVGDGLVVVRTGLGDVVDGTGLGDAVVGTGLGDVVVGTVLGDVVVGTRLGGELGDGLDDEEGRGIGLGDDAGPDCATQRTKTDLAGHLGAAATDTRVSFPDARQA
jgi:hypothetical protein